VITGVRGGHDNTAGINRKVCCNQDEGERHFGRPQQESFNRKTVAYNHEGVPKLRIAIVSKGIDMKAGRNPEEPLRLTTVRGKGVHAFSAVGTLSVATKDRHDATLAAGRGAGRLGE